MKKRVIILAGGISKERLISLETAKSVYRELKKNKKYKSIIAEPDGKFLKKIKTFKPDIIFNALHGQFEKMDTSKPFLSHKVLIIPTLVS